MMTAALGLAFLAMTPSCTLVGCAISPITVPVDAVRCGIRDGTEAWKWATFPLVLLVAPLIGAMVGLRADYMLSEEGDFAPMLGMFTPVDTFSEMGH